MSYRFDFDSTHRILRCRFEGRVTDDELKEYYLAAGRLVAVKDPKLGITDFTAADSVDVSPQTVRELASLPPVMTDQNRIRCVVAPSDKVFGLARMFELQDEGIRANLHVVRTMKEALAILGVQEPKFDPVKTD
jgi:hypothetical protein